MATLILYLAAILVAALALFCVACFLAQAACLAYMPFAAIRCARIARRRGLPVARYALLGAIGAACFVMPYVYLTSKMRGAAIGGRFVGAAHRVLFICWGLFLLGIFVYIFYPGAVFSRQMGTGAINAYLALQPVGWAMWWGILIYYRKANRRLSGDGRAVESSDLTRRYRIAPFVGASATALVFWGVPVTLMLVIWDFVF